MADNGFTIGEGLFSLNVWLNISSFLRGKKQVSEKEVVESRRIASFMLLELPVSVRVVHNTIALFIPEVRQAINDEYEDEVFAFQTNPDEWREVAQKIGER